MSNSNKFEETRIWMQLKRGVRVGLGADNSETLNAAAQHGRPQQRLGVLRVCAVHGRMRTAESYYMGTQRHIACLRNRPNTTTTILRRADMSVKCSACNFWGRKWLHQFCGRLAFFGPFCWTTPMPIKFIVWGGVGGSLKGGVEVPILFLWVWGFSDILRRSDTRTPTRQHF